MEKQVIQVGGVPRTAVVAVVEELVAQEVPQVRDYMQDRECMKQGVVQTQEQMLREVGPLLREVPEVVSRMTRMLTMDFKAVVAVVEGFMVAVVVVMFIVMLLAVLRIGIYSHLAVVVVVDTHL